MDHLNKIAAPVHQMLVDTEEAARLTSLSRTWLEQLRCRGEGPKWVKLGRAVRYRPEDLAAWLEDNVREPKAA